MAHHQKHSQHRTASDLAVSTFGSRHVERLAIPEDDDPADIDEPPDQHVQFARHTYKPAAEEGSRPTRLFRSHSLLTQSLTSPELRAVSGHDVAMLRAQSIASNDSAISGVSTAELTSDGGMTSPARTSTPSPPLPSAIGTGLALIPTKSLDSPIDEHSHVAFKLTSSNTMPVVPINPPQPDAPRKRCITFACANPRKEKPKEEVKVEEKPAEEPKRRSCLKFACPLKPAREGQEKATKPPSSPRLRRASPAPSKMLRKHRDSESTIKDEKAAAMLKTDKTEVSKKTNPEGLRFHEFAASKPQEESWITATPVPRHKLTVSDCLRKENAIRKIGEEAEEEALEEEDDEEEEDLKDELEGRNEDDDDEDDEDDDSEDQDDGNETDDEEGFADSDDESDAGSDFQFWTPATTTAATSIDHLEHIRPRQHRTVSESSIDSNSDRGVPIEKPHHKAKHSRIKRRGSPRMRPGTPELPDSTDFVCGTLDEDQPLEAAYLSCMEQRRIAKQGVLPQDVDPSFPTSEPDQDEDDDDEDELDDGSDGHAWIPGRPDDIDETPQRGRTGAPHHHLAKSPVPALLHHAKSPMPSPKRHGNKSPQPKRVKSPAPITRRGIAVHSPAPIARRGIAIHSPAPIARRGIAVHSPAPIARRGIAIHSPAPRRLFGRSPAPMISPGSRLVQSPPSSRRNSPTSDAGNELRHHHHLAQRPHLTHTKSLPKAPNPFWREHRRRRLAQLQHDADRGSAASSDADTASVAEVHSRGPIDIVQGLEHKRQRRKEKFWRQHCRLAAKEKEKSRRPQPGKGAERMRELGLEMADRTKAYGARLQLVLSI